MNLNTFIIVVLPVQLNFSDDFHGPHMARLGWLVQSSVVNLGEPVRNHIIQLFIYRRVYYFSEPSDVTVWHLVLSGSEPISFI